MKFLELAELDVLSRALNLSTPTLRVSTRVEAYSCKAVSRERKLFKTLESELIQDISHSTSVSPPEHHQHLLDSAFGPLDKRESRKTLWLLIGLLNVAFPDHDFSRVRPEEFKREESARAVLSSLSSALDHLRSPTSQRSFSTYPPSSSFAFPSSPFSDPIGLPSSATSANGTTPHLDGDAIPTNPFLRQVLDPIIDLAECEVFSYTPDMDSDPHAAESDEESDDEGDSDAFERDDDGLGMAWEMDGVGPPRGGQSLRHDALHSGRGGGGTGGSGFSSFDPRNAPLLSRFSNANSHQTPMKSFSTFFPASPALPGTPSSTGDWEEDEESTNGGTGTSRRRQHDGRGDEDDPESGSGGLLWSSNYFLFNKKMKRILFISIWARSPGVSGGHHRVGNSSSSSRAMKRKASENPAIAAVKKVRA